MPVHYHATLLLLTLLLTFSLFIWNRWRYDLVSLATLLFLSTVGVIPFSEAFLGFSHPAVITVVAVLIISKGIQNSGVLDYLSASLAKNKFGVSQQLIFLCGITAFLSAFINNIGALAVILPLVMRAAKQQNRSPSLFLMPVAFSSLLGGLTTLIGTPPNIIVSAFREESSGMTFRLFDYSFAGLPTAILGIVFLAFIGWRFLPVRKDPDKSFGAFDVGDYTTELEIPEESEMIGKTFVDLQNIADGELVLLVRANKEGKRLSTRKSVKFKAKDILVIEGPPEALKTVLDKTDLQIVSNEELEKKIKDKEAHLIEEGVLLPESRLIGRMPLAKTLRKRYEVALLAVARQGNKIRQRFNQMRLNTGDVLLLRGEKDAVAEMMRETGCLPLESRDIQVGLSKNSYSAIIIFLLSIGFVLLGIFPPQIAFSIGAVLMVAMEIVPVRSVYANVDWSIIVLLGSLLPVGRALETSGAAQMIVESLLQVGGSLGPEWVLALLLITVMFLSDLVNNAAAAALAAPIALRVASSLGVSSDPFLMAVAIGASCAFLTPIGHQSNTLVMGPGGYRFTDYWRLGLPLEILIVLVSLPTILYFWPF